MTEQVSNQFDYLISDKHKANAAIVMRQKLKPVEGDEAVIFPPTYAGIGYNIDTIERSEELKTVCTIDSVGSQANRMEPIFKEPPYQNLIPQVTIEIRKPAPKGQEKGDLLDKVSLLDAGHRIADAAVRFSDGAAEIEAAFQDVKKGDASRLARLAPTSLVFGCWDSRGTHEKIPRIVRSTIRAYNVHPLTRSAQYVPATEQYEEAFETLGEKERKKFADEGMGHVPSTGEVGGVVLDHDSKIIRESVLSLSALRTLRSVNDEETMKLRRYILGLSLIALTAPQNPLLRMGCELTGDSDNPASWELVKVDGNREALHLSHDEAISFTRQAVATFDVNTEVKTFTFDAKKAKEALKKKDKSKESE
ncbi:MAG: type I-U CRISPR-associated RAMP protein Csb1/Cas7u [Thermodesulfobacteriota bacterium]|nr:type I-U CRISPR-associated RAMP protein Csb1/Cas7u [Thermodesulfobacteriota bacterium]